MVKPLDDFMEDIFVPIAVAASAEALLLLGGGLGLLAYHFTSMPLDKAVVRSVGSPSQPSQGLAWLPVWW
jgi:hypothetical protein